MYTTSNNTKHRLTVAFWEEFMQHPLNKITVAMVVKRAGLHRSTFYLHYYDLYAIFEEIESNFLTEIDTIHIQNEVSHPAIKQFALDLQQVFQKIVL